MELYDAILTRRSIRRYSETAIREETVDKILRAGMYAPSAVNKQPWHFIVFSDPERIEQIIAVHPNAGMLRQAPLGILVCFDEKLQHDDGYGIVDCAAATQNMLLAAHDLGLGACWIGIFPRKQRMETLHSLFQLPPHVQAFAIVSLGEPAESKKQPERYLPERIHRETW